MSTRAPIVRASVWDSRIAVLAVCMLGSGAALGVAAGMSTSIPFAIAGGSLIAIALVTLLAAGWLDALRLLILSLPLPALYSSDSARIAPPLLLSALLLLSWLVARGVDSRPIPWRALPVRTALFMFAAVCCAAGFAQHPVVAARELVNWTVLLGFLLVATAELAGAPQRVRSLALTIAVVAGLAGVAAALETIGVIPGRFTRTTSSLNRAALGFGWPNELGMFMALALPFSVYACNVARGTVQLALARAGLAAAIIGLVATFSRGSWLAVLMASLLLLFVGERRFVLRIWVTALAAGVLLDIATGGAISARIVSTVGDWVVEQRAALMFAGLLMFRAHPITGVGPGGFADSLQEYGPGITWLWDYQPTAQNAYAQMAAETGIIGLLALIVFLVSGLRVLLRAARSLRRSGSASTDALYLRRTLVWSFGVAAALCFVEWTFAHGIGQLIMLVAALGFALGGSTSAQAERV